MNQLVAGVLRIREGVEPGCHAHLDVVEHEVKPHRSCGHQQNADDHIGFLSSGNVEHHQEHEEKHQRAAEVFFKCNNADRNEPHGQKRQKGANIGQVKRPNAPGEHRKHLAICSEVSRQKQHDGNLCHFARLERERPKVQPNATAVDLLADEGNKRRDEQDEAHEHKGVLVACELVEVAHECEHQHHACHADKQPQQLTHRQIGFKARDKGDANA